MAVLHSDFGATRLSDLGMVLGGLGPRAGPGSARSPTCAGSPPADPLGDPLLRHHETCLALGCTHLLAALELIPLGSLIAAALAVLPTTITAPPRTRWSRTLPLTDPLNQLPLAEDDRTGYGREASTSSSLPPPTTPAAPGRERQGPQRGPLTGPNPTNRGKPGSQIHLIVDRSGLPISIGISAANDHDSQALIPLMRGIPPIRSRFGPRRRRPAKLHGDKGYDYDDLRNWLRRRQIVPRIARRGSEASDRPGRHRWVVERTMSWLNGCRRLHRRYERKPEHFLAFVGIAGTLICSRRIFK